MSDQEKEHKEEENKLNLRSDEIKDIMSKSPMWVVRWGISTVFVIIMLGVLMSWFMKYPDIIKGNVSVTHLNPPVKVVSQASGSLVTLYVKEGDMLEAGELIAEIENPLSAASVDELKDYIKDLETNMAQGASTLPSPTQHSGNLGELQSVMNDLDGSIRDYNLRSSYRMDDRELQGLLVQLANEKKLVGINDHVLQLAEENYNSAKVKFEAEKELFESGVIARADFLQAQSIFNQREIELEKARLATVQNQININSIETRIEQIKFNKVSKDKSGYGTILAHMETIRSYLFGWRQQYILTAPVAGKVSFLSHLKPGMHVRYDQALFAMIRADNEFIAHGFVPVTGAGKLAIGQDVSILLDNFPYHEYGVVMGKVQYVADIPTDNTYRVEISLPEGLLSTYGDTLKSSPEMIGNIEVITEDKRVLQRIMHSIIKIFESR